MSEKVTDADREAENKWALSQDEREQLACDFAANRIAAIKAERERCVLRMRQYSTRCGDECHGELNRLADELAKGE